MAFRPVKQRNVKPAVHRLAKQQSNPSYTIQLLASHDVNQLRAFVVAHHLQGRTEIHQTKHRGKAWYVLTLGHYPQKKNARDVLKQLPSDVAQYKPWTRPVSEITAMG